MTVSISIDGREYQVERGAGKNLLEVALSLGFDLPYFCWHPALGSVGACRQCAVRQFRDEKDTRGRLQMACMIPVADGLRVAIEDEEAQNFRRMICEWLMVNHPHDCPVCDEGGECHLQDMTVMTGHAYRRTPAAKRTFENQDLGPFVNHEMNRCIQCYRCVRFYRDYANGTDLRAFSIRNQVYFGREQDGVLESPFAGNLVEVCPTGVFTDKTLKEHYTRKWDLQTAPSVCVHCGVGCNTIPGERYGVLRRILNRYHHDINGYFLCDRGRYGYEFVNSDRRLRQPLTDGRPAGADEALARAAQVLASGRAIGIGSPRASLEANFALRSLVGSERFYLGVPPTEHELGARVVDIMRSGPAPIASVREASESDAVLILGEDVTHTAPRLALALRQSACRKGIQQASQIGVEPWDFAALRFAIEQCSGPLYILAPAATDLQDRTIASRRLPPDETARFAFAVAHALDPHSPAPDELSEDLGSLAEEVAGTLLSAESPLVVSGTGGGSLAVLEGAANVARALHHRGRTTTKISLTVPDCNSLGLALLGGLTLQEALAADADTVIVLENDLYRQADMAVVDRFLHGKHVIALDHLATPTTAEAEIVLPAATFAETSGTLVNNEGRAQHFYQVLDPEGEVRASWRWLADLHAAGREETAWPTLDDVDAALARELPVFARVLDIAPAADFRLAGQRIPRQAARYSGRTALRANVSVHEPKPPSDVDAPLAFSMEGYDLQPPPALLPRFWAPGWNSIQSLTKFEQEVAGPLRGGDPGQRLIEPNREGSYVGTPPRPFRPQQDAWLVVAVPHVFGSDELSSHAPGVAELAPHAYLGLNAGDAARMRLSDGQQVSITPADGGSAKHLPLKLVPSLAPGLAAVPVGVPGLAGMSLPAWYRLGAG